MSFHIILITVYKDVQWVSCSRPTQAGHFYSFAIIYTTLGCIKSILYIFAYMWKFISSSSSNFQARKRWLRFISLLFVSFICPPYRSLFFFLVFGG